MALVHRIDPTRPMSIDGQRRIEGHVDGHAHAPDGMGAAARRGPACMSCRRSTRLAHMVAIAITLAATSAFAGERADAVPAPQAPAATQGATNPAPQAGKEERIKRLGTLIVLGAVSDPRDAGWVDDSSLPELPVISVDAEAREDAVAQPRAAHVASGAY